MYFAGTPTATIAEPHMHQGLLGKVDNSSIGSVYSRHPAYDWPFNAAAVSATHKNESVNSGWWDMHSTAGSWLDMGNAAAAGMHATMANYATGTEYTSFPHSLSNTAHLLSSGQHLLQDTYKILPSQSVGGFTLPHTANTAPPTPQAPSPRSQRRYSGRATCDCPNCQEAERLGPAGLHLRKRNIHSCHIPGNYWLNLILQIVVIKIQNQIQHKSSELQRKDENLFEELIYSSSKIEYIPLIYILY